MIRSILNTVICMAMNQAASQVAASKISNSSSTLFGQTGATQPHLPWTVPMVLPLLKDNTRYSKRKHDEF
jgi:hypothetical protein